MARPEWEIWVKSSNLISGNYRLLSHVKPQRNATSLMTSIGKRKLIHYHHWRNVIQFMERTAVRDWPKLCDLRRRWLPSLPVSHSEIASVFTQCREGANAAVVVCNDGFYLETMVVLHKLSGCRNSKYED
ncbi:Uncharacterized protein Fot_12995 [Forsythia ovata]|uniref:Uncharacterized protein n=1 Tax=Forsythia ovata TaxID=205694 RepID=A0ABD1W279_9LAMI